eukprot:202993_1
MSTKKKILLIFGYIRCIESTGALFSIVPLPVTSVIHQYYTKVSHRNISKDSLIDLYTFAQQLNDDNLTRIIWKWLGRKPKQISEPLINLIFERKSCLELIKLLQKDCISINEQRIFTHIIHWLKKQYLMNSSTAYYDTHKPRDIIEPILQYIRFPLMSNTFLSNNVYHSGLLTDAEFLGILRAKFTKDNTLTKFNTKKRKKRRKARHSVDLSDDFDNVNMNDIQDDWEYEEVTEHVNAILNSGEYEGYPMEHMYTNTRDYWCSCDLSSGSNVWIVFDCQSYKIGKIEIKFQTSYACAVVKVYSSDTKTDDDDWNRVTKKQNMPQNTALVHTIRVRDAYARFIKLKFGHWSNGYVGIERIRFYQKKEALSPSWLNLHDV